MKKIIFAAAALAARLDGHAGSHHAPGAEGMQADSVPPPGTYSRGYGVGPRMEPFKAPGNWLRAAFGRVF